MRLRTAGFLTVALMALGPACSLFESDDEPAPQVLPAQPVRPEAVPVSQVLDVELGNVRDGVVISARGVAPGLGYSRPRLRPRRQGRPSADGILDFDFVAQPPDPGLSLETGQDRARAIRADFFARPNQIRGVRGVAIHTLGNTLSVGFGE